MVGGALNFGSSDRSKAVHWASVQSGNPGRYWELPHIAGVAQASATAAFAEGKSEGGGGTSAATPQIAGIVASLLEANSDLVCWNEAMFAGILVGADEKLELSPFVPAVWPMQMHDDFDDFDGAGLVNAERSFLALRPEAKVSPDNVAVTQGHDYGFVNLASNVTRNYNALVPAGATLVAASMMPSNPGCDSAQPAACDDNPFPRHLLTIVDPNAPGLLGWKGLSWNG